MNSAQIVVVVALFALSCEGSSRSTPPSPTSPPPSPTGAPAPSTSPSTVAAGVHFVLHHSAGARPESELPMIVAIHGLGDAPERFQRLLATFPHPARIVFPRGLTSHGSGYSWFGRGSERAQGIRSAAARLAVMIDELTDRHPTRGKAIVTGFSQGGMLSYALAVRHPQRVAAAFPLAGALPVELVPLRAPDAAPPIFAFHGDADPVLPIAPTRELTALLRERGFEASLVEYPGVQHTVSPQMFRALTSGLREHL